MKCSVSFTGHTHVRGFFVATKHKFKQYRYKRYRIREEAVCFGIPPITNQNKRNGFCIFDTDNNSIKVIKL